MTPFKLISTACICLLLNTATISQTFTRADSLRGGLRDERTCYDVHYYKLHLQFNETEQSITGSNTIHAIKKSSSSFLQVDLFDNMTITSIKDSRNRDLSYHREHHAVFIEFPSGVDIGQTFYFTIHYSGKPLIAKNPPWDGGFTWSNDKNGNQWISVSCEGIGASLWWPNKDHLSDKPDSATILLTVPANLYAVSNGELRTIWPGDNYQTYEWHVSYPINNYNITFYLGDYVHFHEKYQGIEQDYLLQYYVLSYNLERAKKHFEQVSPMLGYYEKYLGPYPFPRDGFALVEAPYLGMEHQSAIAYGNDYKPGYDGFDYSMLGLNFDYIIIHEAAHEYWGNSVSMEDIADMWIHEGFCTYSEIIYVESRYGKEIADRYAWSWQYRIMDDEPVIGPYHVNYQGSVDMYYKGATMLHMLRHLVKDDERWWNCLRNIQKDFRFRVTNTNELVAYINEQLGNDYTWLFNQYLRHKRPPLLEIKFQNKGKDTHIQTRWTDSSEDFCMPVFVMDDNGQEYAIPTRAGQWTETIVKRSKLSMRNLDTLHYYYRTK